MNKYIKWGIVVIIVIGLTILGIRTFTPKVNDLTYGLLFIFSDMI